MRLLPALPAALLLAAGCKLGPDYVRPETPAPAAWRTPAAAEPGPPLADVAWWEFYRDPVLTDLIAAALAGNQDLRIAAARLEEARGGYRAQRSFLFPAVDASAGWTRGRAGDVPPGPGATAGQFDLAGVLSYEVDLWGRLRRLNESARARLLAGEAGRRAVQLGLIAEVAGAYFNLRALDLQLQIARDTLASRRDSLALTQIKFDDGNGIVSELDVRQAETQVHAAASAIASLSRAVALAENALSLLLGRNPGDVARGDALPALAVPEHLPAGLPSELLLRRPDVLAAEQELIAANADIGAARAAYFPTISLTAALGLQSVELEDLFDAGLSRTWRFAPQFAGPVFNAGRIRGGVEAAEARRDAAVAAYGRAIQNAFREVDDALAGIAWLRGQLAADEAGVQAERRRLELSRLRYEGGVADFSDVLDAERFLFSAELAAVQTRRDLLATVALLYKALGGGWTEAPAGEP